MNTIAALELWAACAEKPKYEYLMEQVEDYVLDRAEADWGDGTKVIFDRANRTAKILNSLLNRDFTWAHKHTKK